MVPSTCPTKQDESGLTRSLKPFLSTLLSAQKEGLLLFCLLFHVMWTAGEEQDPIGQVLYKLRMR